MPVAYTEECSAAGLDDCQTDISQVFVAAGTPAAVVAVAYASIVAAVQHIPLRLVADFVIGSKGLVSFHSL